MQVTITAVGPDHRGLTNPIIYCLTGRGTKIAEIQMYDHDEQGLLAMPCRIELPSERRFPLGPSYWNNRQGEGTRFR